MEEKAAFAGPNLDFERLSGGKEARDGSLVAAVDAALVDAHPPGSEGSPHDQIDATPRAAGCRDAREFVV